MSLIPDAKSPDMKANGQRYDHFQIMRGVACSMVFLNHVVGLLSRNFQSTGSWYEPLIIPWGFPWVWLFLVLSGFLLTKQFVDGKATLSAFGILKFYERRCRRLLPMLWFVPLLLAILYRLKFWSPYLPTFLPLNEIRVALALPWVPYLEAGNPVASVNSPVWSAVLEVHYFLLLPLILWCTKMSSQAMLAGVGLWLAGMVGLAVQIAVNQSPTIFPMIYQQHIYNGGFMLAGCALALLKWKPYRIGWRWPIFTVTTFIVSIQYLATYNLNLALALLPIVALPVFSFLVIQGNSDFQSPVPTSAKEFGLARGLLRWIELMGMMSYSIYLLHKPLAYIVIAKFGLDRHVTDLPSLALTTCVTAIAIAPIIILSFILIEDRFRHRRYRSLAPIDRSVRS